jgi:hypothetical protein
MSENSTPLEEERMRILRMVEEGTINASEALTLLSALGRSTQVNVAKAPEAEAVVELTAPAQPAAPRANGSPRFLRVRVSDLKSGKQKVVVNLPIQLVDWGMRFAANFTDELKDMQGEKLSELLAAGGEGKIIDVMDDEDGEHVEIYID